MTKVKRYFKDNLGIIAALAFMILFLFPGYSWVSRGRPAPPRDQASSAAARIARSSFSPSEIGVPK